MENKISIIVPVYNVEQYLNRCIKSILNQTFKDFELILVNDGSTDASGDICNYYATQDERVKVIHQNNGGLSSARNAGLNMAVGEYIGFVDSDDYINRRMYEILYNNIINFTAELAICDFIPVQENDCNKLPTSICNKVSEYNNISSLEQLYEDNGARFIVSWNKLYKKDLFDNLRFIEGKIHEDEFIIHKLLYRCNKIVFTKAALYYYVQRETSIMNTRKGVKRLDAIYALEDRMNFLSNIPEKHLFQQTIDKYIRVLLIEYNLSSENQVYKLLSKSVRNHLRWILQNRKSNKEKIAFIVFALSPKIYSRLIKS